MRSLRSKVHLLKARITVALNDLKNRRFDLFEDVKKKENDDDRGF